MDYGKQESLSRSEDQPGTLDVVDYGEGEYQIKSQIILKGKPTMYLLKDTSQENWYGRLHGASFSRYSPSRSPQGAHVEKREEFVLKVGKLTGGKWE